MRARLVDELVVECRVECLWSYRPDYYPRSDQERRAMPDAIQERCSLVREKGRPWPSPGASTTRRSRRRASW